MIGNIKAEKYIIITEANGQSTQKVRFGFGAAGEEVQKILETPGTERVRIHIDGATTEATFLASRAIRLVDIKQRIKMLSMDDY